MTTLVLTVIGDDRAGLVDALSGVVVEHEGSWQHSHLSRLAGKFAGIVVVSLPDRRAESFAAALEPLRAAGLQIVAEGPAGTDRHPGAEILGLHLVGQDRPGIVHEIARALNSQGVSLEELVTETRSAAMSGETLFEASASLRVPAGLDPERVRSSLERLADELIVDLELGAVEGTGGRASAAHRRETS